MQTNVQPTQKVHRRSETNHLGLSDNKSNLRRNAGQSMKQAKNKRTEETK